MASENIKNIGADIHFHHPINRTRAPLMNADDIYQPNPTSQPTGNLPTTPTSPPSKLMLRINVSLVCSNNTTDKNYHSRDQEVFIINDI